MNVELFYSWIGFLLIPAIVFIIIGFVKYKTNWYFLSILISWLSAALILAWFNVRL